jgi:hypothetical protein
VVQSYFDPSVPEVPSSVLFSRRMVEYINISQIIEKSNPYIHGMFKNFTAIAFKQLLFAPDSGFDTPCPSKT